jgi:hypothetical protein
MKLKFIESNGEIITKMIKDEDESEFNYIEFIEVLYNREQIGESIYEGDITEISKIKLQEMAERINDTIHNSIQETESSNEDETIEEEVAQEAE